MKTHNRILMTGAAGGIGLEMRKHLHKNCAILRLSDIASMQPALAHEEVVQADLADKTSVHKIVENVDAIVHFGGISTENTFDNILQANIIGLHNLYDAARKHGVKRILFASSNHVTGYYKQSETIDALAPPRPDSYYGLSKAFGEDLAQLYYDKYGIETASMRIGSCFPEPRGRRNLASWLSYDDMYRLITACLTTTCLGHTIVFATSKNNISWWDNSKALHIGFHPQDSVDSFREKLLASPNPDGTDLGLIYQGGDFVKADLT
jgi:uronate dehydrogenase